MTRCTQLERTLEIGMTSRGTVRRLMKLALSMIDVVPLAQASVKKLYGTSPHSTKVAKCGMVLLAKIFVKTNVMTPIMTKGLRSDQKTPRDILRYRILKSFWMRFGMT